ncbi:MAG: tetratricopeptide repeat protein [Ginsengibacter sp.]
MMRVSFYSLIAMMICFLASCNSHDKETTQELKSPNSIQSLKDDIQKYPDSLALIQNLIESYRNKGYYDSALAVTDSEIKKDSGNAYLWNIKATLFFENNDTPNAIKSLEHAIDIYPLPEYLIALGTIYAETKNKNALMIANELLHTNKTKSGKDAYFIKGLYYNYMNEFTEAISYLDSSLRLDFTYMYSYREKAIALYNLEKYQEALAVLKRAVTIQNNFDEGYYWMGRCYEKLNQKEEAIQSYQNALLYDKDFAEAREALNRLKKE